MGVGSSRNNRMFVVDKKVRPTFEKLDASFNRTAARLKSVLREEIEVIKKIDPADTTALRKSLSHLISLRENAKMYMRRLRKMIPMTDKHRAVLSELRKYLARIRYRTSRIGKIIKTNKKFNTYLSNIPDFR